MCLLKKPDCAKPNFDYSLNVLSAVGVYNYVYSVFWRVG